MIQGTGPISLPTNVEIEPITVPVVDRHLRKKTRKITDHQDALRKMYRPQLSRDQLRNASQRTALFKVAPAEPSSGEGAEYTINTLPDARAPKEESAEISLAERAFRGLFKTNRFNYDDLLPWRLRVCYRFVREMARLRALVTDGDLLSEIESNVDHWMHPLILKPAKLPRDISQALETIQIFAEAELLAKEDQYSRPSFKPDVPRFTFPGIALLPPPVPDRFIDQNCQVSDDYDPYKDSALLLYIEALVSMSWYLKIEQGCKLDPQLGIIGTRGVFDPEVIRLIFPTRTQFMAWEELLIEETIDVLIEKGSVETQKYLKESHGLVSYEIAHLIKACKVLISRHNEFDPDEERALMALRIEDYIKRARDAVDLKAESFGLKQLSLINGLGKTDPEDANNDMFIEVARKVSSMRPAMIEGSVKVIE